MKGVCDAGRTPVMPQAVARISGQSEFCVAVRFKATGLHVTLVAIYYDHHHHYVYAYNNTPHNISLTTQHAFFILAAVDSRRDMIH